MKARFLYMVSLLMLLFAAPATAQVVMISGSIEAQTENEWDVFEYDKYVKVYTFVQLKEAKEALATLTANPKATITYAYAQKAPEKYGDFRLEFDKTNDGAMLVWCSDKRYDSKIIEKRGVYSGMIVNLNFKGSEEKKEENVQTVVEGVNENSIAKGEIENIDVVDTRIINKAFVSKNEEEGGIMVSETTIKIPFKVKPNTRVVAQPVWYDRVDITDDASDTVFSYGKVVFCDRNEYGMTQSRLMDFDDMRDTLINYTQTVGDNRYMQINGNDTVKSQIYFSEKYDTIFVHLLDTLTGHDPNGAHPYPFGAMVAIGDYNTTLKVTTEKGEGERSDYMKFLDFKFKEFLPIAKDFEERMEDERMEKAGEMRLNFRVGKAEVEPGDTVNYKELKKLRDTFDEITNDPSGLRGLVSVDVYGMASPDGNVDKNKDLARRRAQYAINEIRRFTNRAVRMQEPEVAGWDKVVDELRKDSLFDQAKEVGDIVAAYSNDRDREAKIKTLPYYESLIREIYLPRLRTVRYKYIENKFGQPEPEVVINRYKANKKAKLGRPEYWMLFNNITDKAELEEVAKYALEVTRNTYDADSIYGKGYWPYAAVLLACCYIGRDTVDLNLLTPFLNTDIDSGKVQTATKSYSNLVNGKRIAEYINFPEVAANQLIMVLNRRNSPMYRHVPAYEAMMKDKGAQYDTLFAVSKCLRGGYKVGAVSKTEEEAARVRQVVASTSVTNSVIVNLAMAYSGGEKAKTYLETAKTEMASLPDNAKSEYLKALVYFQDENKPAAEQHLSYSFLKDLDMMSVANNDLDLVDRNTDYRVLPNAISFWKDSMTVVSQSEGEKQPFTYYKKALDELLVKGENADKEAAKAALYKCFDMDSRYKGVLNVSLKKDKAISAKKEVVKILKELRNGYNRED